MSKKSISKYSTYNISQNFLTGRQVLARITRLSSITNKDTVLEIGTGKGHLACALAKRCGLLHTIEIDRTLFYKAQQRLVSFPNIRLIHGDFLHSQLPKVQPYKVFANIPFSITSQIIEKLTNAKNPPSEMWLIMEKGAAKRYLGKPHETMRSLLLKPKWDMRIVYYFHREDFHPCPRADIVLVHFSRKQQPDISPEQWLHYVDFIKHSIQYGIYGNKHPLTKKQASQALKAAGYPPDIRSGLMLYVQWLCLFRCWQSK